MSRNRAEQQATERRHVEEFLRRVGIAATPEYGDKPDAILVIDGRRIGIEHRELEEERLARNWANLERMDRAMNDALRPAGVDENLSVGVGVDAWAPIFSDMKAVKALAGQIATLAAKCGPHVAIGQPIEMTGHHLLREGVVGPSLLLIARRERPLPEGFRAFTMPGFWGPGDSTVREAVRDKEKRLASYAESAVAEVWLLLVTGERWTQATDSAMTEWTQVTSEYDRVYLLDLRTGAVQRLDRRADAES